MVEVMTHWARLELPIAVMTRAGSGAPVVERWGVLRLRLEDVGDRWRALLLGAPPAVL